MKIKQSYIELQEKFLEIHKLQAWEKRFIELWGLSDSVRQVIWDMGDMSMLLENVRELIEEAQTKGYKQGRLRCLQHHYRKELNALLEELSKKIEGMKLKNDKSQLKNPVLNKVQKLLKEYVYK